MISFLIGLILGLLIGLPVGLALGALAVGAWLTGFIPRSSLHK